MNNKIIWTTIAVAMAGALASTFLVNYDDESMTYKILTSGGFGFATGLVVAGTTYTYYIK